MNQHLVARSFEDFLAIFGLHNHVDFPTHISGSSLDPVITDLTENLVRCSSLGTVGSSDHQVIYTKINIETSRDPAVTRMIWLWDKADWQGMRAELENINWYDLFKGEINDKVKAFTDMILTMQYKYIPHRYYTVKPRDQPWFGPNCRAAAEVKSKAWINFKRNPTRRNKDLHTKACKEMKNVQKWAHKHWKDDLKRKLSRSSVGSKAWWNLVKQQQGFAPDDSIPPLDKPDGSVATSGEEKAELLASYFAGKMTVPDTDRPTPFVPSRTNKRLSILLHKKK